MRLVYKKDYFSSYDGKYESLSDEDFEILKEHLPSIEEGARLLDLGGGSGALGERVAQFSKAGSVATLDFTFPLLKWCSSPCCQGDATYLPFADDAFDCVLVGAAFHHFPDIVSTLQEIHRILRPGGAVYAYDPNLFHPQRIVFMTRPLRYYFYQSGDVALSPYWFRRALRAKHFDDVKIDFIAFGGEKASRLARFNSRVLNTASRNSALFLEPFLAPWYVITARKSV